MPSYDPQRSRHRPSPADDDQPAPVDALLEPHPTEPALPEGVELELTDAGGAVLHTASADVEVTPVGRRRDRLHRRTPPSRCAPTPTRS